MANIFPGQWIKIDCKNSFGLGFEHDGIVVDVKSGAASPRDVRVIHYMWKKPTERREITESTLESFMAMGIDPRVVNEITSTDAATIVKRARSQLGRADYNLLGGNCQHFAHWCYHGSPFSREVFKISAFGAAFGVVVAIAGLVCMSAARG